MNVADIEIFESPVDEVPAGGDWIRIDASVELRSENTWGRPDDEPRESPDVNWGGTFRQSEREHGFAQMERLARWGCKKFGYTIGTVKRL